MNPPQDLATADAGSTEPARADSGRSEGGGLVERFDTNKDGKVARSEIPEGPTRRVFDGLVEKHKLDANKTYTVAELRKAIGLTESSTPDTPGPQRRQAAGGYNQTLRFVASPVATPGLIVVPSAKKGNVLALRPDLKGDATNSRDAKLWTMPRGTPDVPSPLVHDGLVYLVSEDGVLTCLDAKSGERQYQERLHGVRHRASPIYADGHVFVPAFDGHVTVVKAGRKLEIVSNNELGETLTASPVVSGGTLYLRTFESLWAIRRN
jgi:outer membrane protein assembly factor BamB